MIYATILILIALAERLWFDLGPNFELVTWATVIGAIYLKPRYRLLVPVLIMLLSDLSLGLSSISFFTWTGFGMMSILPRVTSKLSMSKMISGTLSGIIGVLLFFVWTNYGVWVTDVWGMYPDTLGGLLQSYLNALPFLRYQLVSAMVTIPVTVGLIESAKHWQVVIKNKRLWV